MKKNEYDAIFDHLRQCLVVIPKECIIMRFRDVIDVLSSFVVEDDDSKVTCPLCRGEGQVPKVDESKDIVIREET